MKYMASHIAILVALILINAFLSTTEITLASVNIKAEADDLDHKRKRLKKMAADTTGFLSAIQTATLIISLTLSGITAKTLTPGIANAAINAGVDLPYQVLAALALVIAIFVLAYFTLVFGILVPKQIAMKNVGKISSLSIGIATCTYVILKPFVALLSFSTSCIVRLFGIDPKAVREQVTEKEILLMIDAGEELGSIDESEKEMITNIFEFNNTTVGEIATHRTDIIALCGDATEAEIKETAARENYSRIPVYNGNIDNIIGILFVKDVFKRVFEGTSFELKNIVRKPYFVPFSKKTDELFEEMQKNKIHMAVVIDEYGGTMGIVTMEDLIEEVMGDIQDEYDDEQPEIQQLEDGALIICGTVALSDVAELLDVSLPTEEYDTLSGFLIDQLGRIPGERETPAVEFGGVVFKIVRIEEKRIAQVRATAVQ